MSLHIVEHPAPCTLPGAVALIVCRPCNGIVKTRKASEVYISGCVYIRLELLVELLPGPAWPITKVFDSTVDDEGDDLCTAEVA